MYCKMFTFWYVLVYTLFGQTNGLATYNDSMDLRASILSNYNVNERPLSNLSSVVNVDACFELVSIQDIDAVTGVLTVTGVFILSWTDQRLVWDPLHYGLKSVYFGINEIWHPILVLKTSAAGLDSFTENWMIIRVYFDGRTTHFPSGVFKTICNIDVRYYPFDRQVCTVDFVVFAFLGTEVALNAIYREVQRNFFIDSNGEWNLESTSVETVAGVGIFSDGIKIHFTLKRRAGFLIVNVLLPIIFMAYINVLVFVLPAECGERIGYAITVLLALAVFLTLVSDNLPKSSQPMSIIGYYLMVMLIVSVCMVIVTTFNLVLYFKEGIVPGWVERLTKTILCYRREGRIKRIQVSPKVANVKGPKGKIEKTEKDREPVVTWKDVSYAVDVISIVTFLVVISLTNIIALVIIASN